MPFAPQRSRLDEPGGVGYRVEVDEAEVERDSDIYALQVARQVAVTPLSLDLTSRVELADLERRLRRSGL